MRLFWSCILVFSVVYVFQYVSCIDYSPIVTIPDGQVRGIENQTIGENKTYYAYKGIPYAQPPVGDLRFAAPVKNDAWSDVLNATGQNDKCTQMDADIVIIATESNVIGSEDCLYIDVYTTDLNSSLPVMVWFYGGAFSTGSSNSSGQPDYFLDNDVVFVSFNYRLGVFGFLSTEDDVIPGNWGLKDQILALKWVKDNIEYFGGNPENITIFGQSAGAASVSYMINTNQTEGLFTRAIMESASSLCLWALTRNAEDKAFDVGSQVGVSANDSQTLLDSLREINYKKLKVAENTVTIATYALGDILAGLPFGPVEEPDSSEAVVTDRSYEILESGDYNSVSTLIGFNSNEAGGYAKYVAIAALILLEYDLQLSRFAPYDLTENDDTRTVVGTEIRLHYFGIGLISLQATNLITFVNVDQFIRPIRETVNLMSQYGDVYYYEFSYEGELGESDRDYAGVAHSEELNYLFYTGAEADDDDELTRQRLVSLWTNFAKTGDPLSFDNYGVLENVTWIANTAETNATDTVYYLNINDTLTLESNPFQSDWEYYGAVYDTYGNDSYYTTY
ncbi:venom carboxylesterase-6-like [Sitophilus oryzae]|uniref:Carboxylic ester hydrolase n=1 Tax=Sitophilus oryzae TaxID=7048 RepID=A0A6J2XNH3_SITOR|nr:venom carboxylesterase-6-like [Sitophilus oryzae]